MQRATHQTFKKHVVSAVRPSLQSLEPTDEVCEVEQQSGAPIDLDLSAIAESGQYGLLYKWKVVHQLSSLRLAPVVDEAVESLSSLHGRELSRVALAMDRLLASNGAWSGGGAPMRLSMDLLENIDASTISVLSQSGAIAVSQSEFFEPQATLQPWAVVW